MKKLLLLTILILTLTGCGQELVKQNDIVVGADSGFKSPSATGDDYNTWGDASSAYISDDDYAYQSASNDQQDYYNFTFNITSGATINGIEVIVEGDTIGSYTGDMLDVDISHNGGTTYTSDIKTLVDNTGSHGDQITTLGGSTDTWGRTWSATEFSNTNFRLRLESVSPDGPYYVDHIQVKVYYTSSSPSGSSDTKQSIIWFD